MPVALSGPQEIWFSGLGAALISGVFAVVVARLTVVWTMRKSADAARHDRSRVAAGHIVRAVVDVAGKLGRAGVGMPANLDAWLTAVAIEGPEIDSPEVMRRLQVISDEITKFNEWSRELNGGKLDYTLSQRDEWEQRFAALKPRINWAEYTLSAHGNDKPLGPPEPPSVNEGQVPPCL